MIVKASNLASHLPIILISCVVLSFPYQFASDLSLKLNEEESNVNPYDCLKKEAISMKN